jgi:hypothetical protein
VHKHGFIAYPREGFDRSSPALCPEVRKSLNTFAFEESSVGQNLSGSDASLSTATVDPHFFNHGLPLRLGIKHGKLQPY